MICECNRLVLVSYLSSSEKRVNNCYIVTTGKNYNTFEGHTHFLSSQVEVGDFAVGLNIFSLCNIFCDQVCVLHFFCTA